MQLSKSLSRILLQRSLWFIALFQAFLVSFSLVLAWTLRFDFAIPNRGLLLVAVPILIAMRLAALSSFGLMHGWWRYTGISDIVDVVKAVIAGSCGFYCAIYIVLRATNFPRSIYVLEPVITLGLLAGMRFMSRALADSVQQNIVSPKQIAVVGAGFAAQMLIREVKHDWENYRVVACVDDDPTKQNLKVQGVPVMGTIGALPRIVEKHPVDEILIAIPSASSAQMQRIVAICENTKIRFRTMPPLKDLMVERPSFHQLRDVNLRDLLERNPVDIDLASVRQQIQGQTVLVTGAAGSIGSELCRQILEYSPGELVCLDQSETGIFYLQMDLAKCRGSARIIYCVADVRDIGRIRCICDERRPNIIFHAAAYKHVPVMESNVREAIKNNIFGLLNVLDSADASGCDVFVFVSSDKAVEPTTVMGATKRVGELVLMCRSSRHMRCISVRFGNVLGSKGSVVRIFQEQIRNNEELTLTHPEATRFFMTTREAVSLVLHASGFGRHGDILVLDMSRPIRILDLARNLIRFSGGSAAGAKIRFIGLRPGEKLNEQLFSVSEVISETPNPMIHAVHSHSFDWRRLEIQLNALQASLVTDSDLALRAHLKGIVPEYTFQPALHPRKTVAREKMTPQFFRQSAGIR
ncbi:MAG TPA: nucleoside-diphosphate sugar epimerase/dehydratase [Candidatus Acidoferrales bacterium]|nr:nucleoside-diphosphate sugar epimerase/dehydratase [Candidatus Acidoferrales bacterium]